MLLAVQPYQKNAKGLVTNRVLHREVEMGGKEKAVKELKAQIEAVLEERPELKPFQDEIDRRMSKIIDPGARLQVLSFMISGNIMELQDLLASLPSELSSSHLKNADYVQGQGASR